MQLAKLEKIEHEIVVAKEQQNIKALKQIHAVLKSKDLLAMFADSIQGKNKAGKCRLDVEHAFGEYYKQLEDETINRYSSSTDLTTKKQHAAEILDKSRESIRKYVDLCSIQNFMDVLEEYVGKQNNELKEVTTAGFLRFALPYRIEEKENQGAQDKFFGTDEYKIYNDDFANVEIPKGSVDVIITDPPYGIEYKTEWEKLGKFAKRVLKKNGFLITYFGQMNLYTFAPILCKYLYYYWTFDLRHAGNKQLIFPRNIFCGWKPILLFQNGFKIIPEKMEDIIEGSGREKGEHDWQQGEKELEDFILNFTQQGDVVCDPFMGGGTTIMKAVKMNRRGIGIEIKQRDFNYARRRLQEL